MSIRLYAITFGAHEPEREASFWATLLGREAAPDDHGGTALPTTADGQPLIRFVRRDEPKTTLNRAHFDLTSETPDDQQETVGRALEAGARHIDIGQGPDARHTVLADPEGNEFCVIPAGNKFLAGCGAIGALACDGTRAVGEFWSMALQWPLVWDEGEETAIQSPGGGSKISWGGPPVAPQTGYNRVHLDLTMSAAESDAATGRLLELGATRRDGHVCGNARGFADPDGTEFCLLTE